MKSTECIHLGRGTLGAQRHVCAFFRSTEEEYEVLMPFVKEGFERGERALHVLSPHREDDHLRRLQTEGIDTAAARTRGQLDIRPWRDTYLPDGCFEKHRMLATMEAMLKTGASQGYGRTRLVAHMQWGAGGMPRTADWVEYEISLNQMLPKYDDVVICTYGREALDAERIVDALRSHPMLIIGGLLQENPFYIPPDEFLRKLREKDAEQLRVKEFEAAAHIQRALMGVESLQVPFMHLRGQSRPCLEVGGDFFSFLPDGDAVAVAVADVSGKGMPAAILASLLQGIIYEALRSRVPFPEIAQSVNRFLCTRNLGSKYATFVIARLQPDGALEYMNCGHVPPVLVNNGGQISRLGESNLPVGLLSLVDYASAQTRLKPGDHLIIVTDGVTEAENAAGEMFGDHRLVGCAGGEMPMEQIIKSVQLFSGDHPFHDDCTVVDLTFLGGPLTSLGDREPGLTPA
ncbi:MAG TPA: SpoIIE family protein phosphatase [Terriglobales bacterium]|nr:SpoIIE family protein phosphatase [Candidatus Acidoferrum sp.]HUM04014.1 SpoIIE family protein phosphatase [Terriglobales bacterium]HXJ91775.1 SpoIIE family protein phosphatase [Terriglobia bacterium]